MSSASPAGEWRRYPQQLVDQAAKTTPGDPAWNG